MKVRITQKVPHEDAILFPGTEIEVDASTAEQWIAADVAIPYGEQVEEVIKPKSRKAKEVNNGDG
jgi:ADP-glucose pyrophosphorylase